MGVQGARKGQEIGCQRNTMAYGSDVYGVSSEGIILRYSVGLDVSG